MRRTRSDAEPTSMGCGNAALWTWIGVFAVLLGAGTEMPGGGDELMVMVRPEGTFEVGGLVLAADGLREFLLARDDGAGPIVVLRVDPDCRWKSVLLGLEACTEPEVRVRGVRIGRSDEVAATDLALAPGPEDVATVTVMLRKGPADPETRVKLLDRPMGTGAAGLASLAPPFALLRDRWPDLLASFGAWPGVPVRDVLELLRAFAAAGYPPPSVQGVPRDRRSLARIREAAEAGRVWDLEGALGSDDFRVRGAARAALTLGGWGAARRIERALLDPASWMEETDRLLLLDALLALPVDDRTSDELYRALDTIRREVRGCGEPGTPGSRWERLWAIEDAFHMERTRPPPPRPPDYELRG